MKTGVFAGSFCPITVGHVDAIERASKLCDKLYVVVGVNGAKKYAIPDEMRLETVRLATSHISNVEVVLHQGMMTDFCKSVGATVMVKSIRNSTDLQEVINLTDANRDYWDGETVFVLGDSKFRHVSSSLVRELCSLKQDVSKYVPANCLPIVERFLK